VLSPHALGGPRREVAKYRGNPGLIATLNRALQWVSRRSGGIGRRAGLKIRFPPGSVGSSPTFGIYDRPVRVGVLTGGGDCPGLNAVIRAVGRRVMTRGGEVVGVREGWKGLVDGLFEPLGPREISGLLPRGGTIIGTTRTNPFKLDGGVDKVLATFEREGLEALVAIGGEDTLGVASRLFEEHEFPVVGVPKTIDNDLSATDYTFGFDTAVWIATEAIDRLHTTAESHNRVMVVEVMGRHTGWIAVMSGIAGGADVILIPEQPISIDEACADIQRRHERGKDFSIVVVSEGYELEGGSDADADVDQFGHVRLSERGVGARLASEIEQRTGYETRVTVLGHVQRGGSPTPRDRVLATRYGLKAADLVEEREFGRMAALHGDRIVDVPLKEATAELKTVPEEWYGVARAFFG
jgi:ATP-dependent phosphofructokinase / diphosphate-dependent phosphofructokinase